jgi:hypothetical protein
MLPFTLVRSYLDRIARWHRASALSHHPPAGRIAWAVGAMGRRVPGTTCLVEALAAHCVLRRHGYAPMLSIGVRHGAALTLDAHAWVECGGTVVIGTAPALAEYAVLS